MTKSTSRRSRPPRAEPAPQKAQHNTSDGTADSEDEEQRERYREMLEEYRTILPGVQVLLAFLLTAPFAARFADLDSLGRNLFMVAIISTAVAMLLFLTPTALHRIAPQTRRDERVRVAVRAAIAGMVMVAVGVVTAIYVVTRFIYGNTEAASVAGIVGGLAVVLWFLVPLVRRARDGD